MPESMLYSFDDTDALLASLSSSTLSPVELGGSSSGNPSSYGVSPENDLFNDDWNSQTDIDYNGNDFLDFGSNEKQNQGVNMYVSPSSTYGAGSPLNSLQDNPKQEIVIPKKEQASPVSLGSIKQEFGDEEDDEDEEPSPSSQSDKAKVSKGSKITKPLKKDRTNHNIIEKKYRTNINTKINALRDAVPSLRIAKGDTDMSINDLDGLSPASKINKASVLTKATEYIKHLENKNSSLVNELNQLRNILSQQGSSFSQQQSPVQQPMYQTYQVQLPVQQQFHSNQDSQFQPATDNFGNPLNVVSQQQQTPYNIGVPGKVLMGGLATIVGQNLYAGGTDFDYRGLSAFPLLSGPQVQIFISITKLLLVALSALYILVPSVFYKPKEVGSKPKSRSGADWYQLIKQLAFIYAGDQAKLDPDEEEINKFITREVLAPKYNKGFIDYLYALLKLSTYKPSFEVSFGKLTLAKLLISYSDLSSYFRLNSVVNDSLNEIAKQKVSDSSVRYLYKELKSTSAQSSECFKRLLNISLNLDLNTNCQKGAFDRGYYLILQDEAVTRDYKLLLASFRANELFLEVLSGYIDLTFNEKDNARLEAEEIREIKKDLWSKLKLAETLVARKSILDIKIKLFKSILNDKYLDSVLIQINQEVQVIPRRQPSQSPLANNNKNAEENDYDDDDYEDEESGSTVEDEDENDQVAEEEEEQEQEEEQEEEQEQKQEEKRDPLLHLDSSATLTNVSAKSPKLLSKDVFNSLVSSSALRYIHAKKHSETKKLLRHLRTNKDEITLLSLISLFNLIQKYPKEWLSRDERSSFEKVIGNLRLWVGDSNNSDFSDYPEDGLPLKREISDKLVEIGKSFSDLS